MKKAFKLFLLSVITMGLVACSSTPKQEIPADSSIPTEPVVSPEPPEGLTVDGETIALYGDDFLRVGDTLKTDTLLTKPTDKFNTMETTTLESFSGWKIISTVPSLDTPTCSIQTSQIEVAAEQYKDISFITVSADLPFAQNRFCGANGIDNINVLSDYLTLDFAKENHFLMTDFGLLARTILVVDDNNVVQYIEYAHDVVNPINVGDAINFLNQNK